MARGAFWLLPQQLQGPQAVITKYLLVVPKTTPTLCREEQAAVPVQCGYISSSSKPTEPMGSSNPTKYFPFQGLVALGHFFGAGDNVSPQLR